MARIGFRYSETSVNIYGVLTNLSNQHRNADIASFENYDATNWTSYDHELSETDDYFYELILPTLSDGSYYIELFLRAGGSPALTDAKVGEKAFELKDNEFYTLSNLEFSSDDIDDLSQRIAELTRALIRFNL